MTTLNQGSRREAIRNIHTNLGVPESLNRLTHRCIQVGVWDREFIDAAFFRAAREEVHDAMAELDITRMPFAGPTEERDPGEKRSPLWVQRRLWDVDDYAFNIATRVNDATAEYEIAKRLAEECFDRYQLRIVLPVIA